MSKQGPNNEGSSDGQKKYTEEQKRLIREIEESYNRHGRDFQPDPDQGRLSSDNLNEIVESKKNKPR